LRKKKVESKIDEKIEKIKDEYGVEFFTKDFDKEFYGFFESPEKIKERIHDIIVHVRKDRSFYLNAVEAYYIFERFSEDIVKSSDGPYYIISNEAVKKFLRQFKSENIREMIKSLNEIALKIIPKQGEKIEVDAEELF